MKHIAKKTCFILVVLGVLVGCSNVKYSYEELNNIDYSVVTTEQKFIKNSYGYYKNGTLNHFNECFKPSWTEPYTCENEDETITLKYEVNSESNFDSPTLTIEDEEHNLICDSDKNRGKYCIIEE